MGVWPRLPARCMILAWQLADGEATQAWLTFLTQLEAQGIRGENGLQLIIHDGGEGLCAALQIVHFDAAQQRCLFHKLRNIANAIQLLDGLSPSGNAHAAGAPSSKTFRPSGPLRSTPPSYTATCRSSANTGTPGRTPSPPCVATFRATLAYYRIQQQHPDWRPPPSAHHQPPGALQSDLTPTHPHRRRLSLRRGDSGHHPPRKPIIAIPSASQRHNHDTDFPPKAVHYR